MIRYLLETITFQLVFLMIYDLFLKRETFFQWNRCYLLGTFLLAMVLPSIKVNALKTAMPSRVVTYADSVWPMDVAPLLEATAGEATFLESFDIQQWIFLSGALLMAFLFADKLWRIRKLRVNGSIERFRQFTKIRVRQSEVSFSFFKQIFLGDAITQEQEPQIVAHELIHIKQWHSLDLLFFELLRIVFWCNPMVFIYQNRMAELHEFIADAKVVKRDSKEHYQLLLSRVFQTQNFSFVNHFFKGSLIKKRILMLAKEESKTILQLKYLMIVPTILLMLTYSSCENDTRSYHDKKYDFEQIVVEVDDVDDEASWKKDFVEATGLQGRICLMVKDAKDFRKHYFENGKPLYIEDSRLLQRATIAFEDVDFPPAFTACSGDLRNAKVCFKQKIKEHFQKGLRFDGQGNGASSSGSVAVRLTFAKDGSVSSFQTKGSNDAFVAEVKKRIETLPILQPALLGNRPVQMDYVFPVLPDGFKVQEFGDGDGQINPVAFMSADVPPLFPGCEQEIDARNCFQKKMQEHIREHFNYPLEAQEKGIQGRVSVLFTIDKEGRVTNIKKRGPHALLEKEVVRIIERLPKMFPGKHNGQWVDIAYSIPVNFVLNE